MAGTQTLIPVEPRPIRPWAYNQSLPQESSFSPSSPATRPTSPDGTVRPVVETVTMSTLHDMLAQILEQTSALWQAQASTNHSLDELRRSMPAPHENGSVHERLRRVEVLVGTLATGQPTDLDPPTQPGQGINATPGTCQSGSTLQATRQPSSVRDVVWVPNYDVPISLRPGPGPVVVPLQETRREEGTDEVPSATSLSGHVDQSTTDFVILPKQVAPLESSLLPTIGKDGERTLGIQDDHISSTSHTRVSSGAAESKATLHDHQELLESVTRRVDTLCNQLTDVTASIQQISATCGEKIPMKQLTESSRLTDECEMQSQELIDMARWPVKDNTRMEHVVSEIRKLDAEHRELLQSFSEAWRADNKELKDEITRVVRATASEQIPFNIQGYLDEFSTTLSAEVRALLNEVGELREERRRIQDEVRCLVTLQSLFGRGEGSGANWLPKSVAYIPEGPHPAGPIPPRENVHLHTSSPSLSSTEMSDWVRWQPDPTPPPFEPSSLATDRGSPESFGPRSPSSSPSPLPSETEEADLPTSDAHALQNPNASFQTVPDTGVWDSTIYHSSEDLVWQESPYASAIADYVVIDPFWHWSFCNDTLL